MVQGQSLEVVGVPNAVGQVLMHTDYIFQPYGRGCLLQLSSSKAQDTVLLV